VSRHVVVVGGGIAATAAALAAARAGAEVTRVAGGPGASVLATGALDDVPWEEATGPASPLGGALRDVLDALVGYRVTDARALVATHAGTLRPARGTDRALLDLAALPEARVLVPVLDHLMWDGEALARAWNASPLARGVRFIPVPAPLQKLADEHQLPDAELAARHDDPSRVGWLADRLTELRTHVDGTAVLLPPWLGASREVATSLSAKVGVPCGEVLGGVGGPSGARFEHRRDRASAAAGVVVRPGMATRVTHREGHDRAWRVALDAGELEAHAVVLATGGVLGGGLAYTPATAFLGGPLPETPRALLHLTCDAPVVLAARGRPLLDPSSLFGAAPESHAWPHVDASLLDEAGVQVAEDGRVVGAADGLYAAGELAAGCRHTWLAALGSGAIAGSAAARSSR